MKGKRKTGASGGGASATGHTFVRLTESSNGKHLSLVVDVGNSNRCRKFSDDELGDAARFAISTEGVAAFKEFLFPDDGPKFSSRVTDSSFVCVRHNRWTGLRYGVVMARLSNGQLRAISFCGSRGHSRDRSRGDDELIRKAIAFTRSNSFREWREQGKVDKGGGGGGGVGGERVECRCGKNRSRGQMVACDVCGAREHVDCVGYSQIPGDHMCSTCFKAHKEDVIVISMDEQAEGRLLNSGESWSDTKARDRGGGNEAVCSICGCEDNEDFETMIQPCSCDGASLSAHPNCVSLAEECFSKDRRLTCHACGRPSSSKPLPVKRSTRRLPAETSSKAVKRLRSALVHPGKADDVPTAKVKEAVEEKMDVEQNKPDSGLLGRRFSDAPSTVPIKKRRIQIMDSPSRSPSPGTKLDPAEFTHEKENGLDAKTSHGKEVYDERLPKCTQNKVEEEEDPAVLDYELSKDDEFERSEPSRGEMDSDSAVHSNDDGRTTKPVDSGNRSHWDLNMDMDAWERPCEDDTDEQQVDSAGNDISPYPGTDGGAVAGNVVEPLELEEEPTILEAVQSAASDAKPVIAEDLSTEAEVETVTKDADIVNTCLENTSPRADDSQQVTDTTSCTLPDKDPATTDKGEKPEENIVQDSAAKEAEYKDVFTDDTFEEEEEPDSTEKVKTEEGKSIVEAEKVEEGQITTDDWVREAGEEMEAENVDYEDSDDGEEAEEKVAHTEPEYEGEQGEIHDSDTKQETVPEMSGKDAVENNCEPSRGDDRSDTQRRASSSGRLKSSGWDQLPEGFETAEDALRASKDVLKRNSHSRLGAWSGGRLRPPGTSRVSQFDNNFDRFRHDDQSWARHEHDQRGDMYDAETRFYNRDFGRGRSRGGPSSPLVHPRRDLWVNGSAVSQGQWPKHHLSPPPGRFADGVGFVPHGQANAAAVAAAKVESSGFVVAPDGTITKAGSPGAVVRGGRPFPAGSRNPPPLMMNPRLPDPEVMVSGRNIGLSPGMRLPGLAVGPGMGMNSGMRGGRPYVDSPPVSSRGGHYICEHPDGFRGRRSPTMREHRRSRSRSRSNSPRRSFGRHSRSPGYGKVSRELSPASSIPKLPLPPPPPRGQRSPPAGLRRLNDRVERRYFEHDYHPLDREQPRTSGWDLGPGDVGRLAGHGMGRFDDMDRRVDHDRRNREDMHRRVELGRRDKSATSSRHPGAGGSSRDVEDEVAPRRRRPPSS